MPTNEEDEQKLAELAETYGPLYPFSQHKRGEMIRYTVPGSDGIYLGEVLWVQSPSEQGGVQLPMRYVVYCEERGFVDIVFVTDLVRA